MSSFTEFKSCIRKVKHTKESAIAEAKRLAKTGSGYQLDIYPCSEHWHVGHSKRNSKANVWEGLPALLRRCSECNERVLAIRLHVCREAPHE